MSDTTKKQSSTKELVYDAVIELHSLEQIITRETLSEHLDLTLGVIDDRLKSLTNDGLIARVQRGVYVPIQQYRPKRIISLTELPDGNLVIDIGNVVLDITPVEARSLAVMLGFRAFQASQIELGQKTAVMTDVLERKIRSLERKIKELDKPSNQASLPFQ